MNETKVESVEAFVASVRALDSGWCFRGHRDATWELTSTLERVFPRGRWHAGLAERLELVAMQKFQTRMPHYVARDVLPQSRLAWLATMQHHGVPTRLLDFTESPLVALFFALPAPSRPSAFSVWAANFRDINKATCSRLKVEKDWFQMNRNRFFEEQFEKHDSPQVILTDPDISNFRLERQKGLFMATNSAGHRVIEVLPNDPAILRKFTLGPELVEDARHLLHMAAIDGSRLFGDLDGFSRDIATYLEWQVSRASAHAVAPSDTEPGPAGAP